MFLNLVNCSMLKSNELRIGNYYGEFGVAEIATAEFILRLYQIEQKGKIAINVSAIPLTKELLLKFGFKHNTEDIFIHENFNAAHFKFKIKKYSNNDCLVLNCKTTVRYVHELQNIYFAIMRNELILNI